MSAQSLPSIVDAGFLTDALRRSGVLDDARVVDLQVQSSFPTILSHIFRLRPIYDRDVSGAPRSLMLKAGLLDRPGGPWKGGRHEVAFYADVAAAMPERLVPRCFDARWESDTGAWHLLLEDLSDTHAVATRWPLPPTRAQCETIIRLRARLHAAWWDDPRLGVTIGTWPEARSAEELKRQLTDLVARFSDEQGDRLSDMRREFYARLIDAAPRLAARGRSRRHMTIVHGDAHVWNCFLPNAADLGEALLFDWDSWGLDVGTDDLAYMMAIHWYPELRRRFEVHLLDAYHDELLRRGVRGYDRRALRDDYRLSVLWLAMSPIYQHANGIPPVIWWNNLERVHLAIDDLGCRELLDG